jgi:bifunctional enzyme CysN/CysC
MAIFDEFAPRSAGAEAALAIESAQQRELLRVITCGSVDDGKSTLVGRLLYDAGVLADDHVAALRRELQVRGAPQEIDFALLLDGLEAEREQGITIDVAYRFFATSRRRFIFADSPGHEQYTRNMVTAASLADVALVLIDARKGVQQQTRRHLCIAHVMGVPHVIAAITKMDLIGFDRDRFTQIASEFRAFAGRLGISALTVIPVSGRTGDNVVSPSQSMSWHAGPALLAYLESLDASSGRQSATVFAMPVQRVIRHGADFRGYAGRIAIGQVRPGDIVSIQPRGGQARVARIVTMDGSLQEAGADQSVILTLDRELDVARGDVIAWADHPLETAGQFEATVAWLDGQPLLPGRSYWLKIGCTTCSATVAALKYRLDINTLGHDAARTLGMNEIGVCTVVLDRDVAFMPYEQSRDLGGFILIDKASNSTVGAGMIHFALRRAHNLHWQPLAIDKTARGALKNQRPTLLWLTGLSGAGKSTIGNLLEQRLHAAGVHTYLLDGDNMRLGLSRDLGFTPADRVENIRRAAEVAKLMVDAGLVVIASFISPFKSERRQTREMVEQGEFVEVFIDTPLAEAERRDVKGLYAKARQGLLPNFTGVDSPYEPPESPEIRIETTKLSPAEAADVIIAYLLEGGRIARVE